MKFEVYHPHAGLKIIAMQKRMEIGLATFDTYESVHIT
jgi:hypothetical protein